jgi:uncharacterized cupin superfamily protein
MKVYRPGMACPGLAPAGLLREWNAVSLGPEPADFIRVDVERPEENCSVGVWSVEVGEFDLTYGSTEFVTILRGRLVISQAGETHELGPGDAFFTGKGETVHWKVLEPVTKAFLAID